MKTIIIPKPGEVEIIEKDIPQPGRNEALLHLCYGGICGTDLHTFRGSFAYTIYPCIPGHELSAEIIEVNGEGSEFKPGMRVTCNPYFNCGKCYSCRKGLVNACVDNKTMGVQRPGGFSEYFTMPVSRLHSGKGIPAKELTLIEPFCISNRIIKRGQVKAGDHVLIIGSGPIGIFAAIAAKNIGANVTICDILPQKLNYAEKNFEIDHAFLNSSDEDFDENVRKLTDSNGFDVVIEAVGTPATFLQAVSAACFGGKVVLSGISKENADFYFTVIQKKELSILGARNALDEDFRELIDLVSDGRISLEGIITNVFPYTEAFEAFKAFSGNDGNMMKVLLDFN